MRTVLADWLDEWILELEAGRPGAETTDHDVYVVNPAHGGGPGSAVYIALRGSTFMSERDIDLLIDRIGNRMTNWTLPAAGVRINR